MSTRESNQLFASFVLLLVSTHIDFCQVEDPEEESQFVLSKKRRIETENSEDEPPVSTSTLYTLTITLTSQSY
ncbi:hypothetical protein DFJ58DRAFT_778322 [Suillus subalutaceus]|uniref:uncharacterized protein n=1 Tax=Suillus subalutaceus TaxID=48586 RepID=UPI001B86F0A0|nr:uncharacterized protein DFJ58DRAFT_778322 [Suillus subalutaceus]KAG1860644.1 hypothetical protein DFJ58DRAFT_778322 [Suillus subalutaceus]